MNKERFVQVLSPFRNDWVAKLISAWFFVSAIILSTKPTLSLEAFKDVSIVLISFAILVIFGAISFAQRTFSEIGIVQAILITNVTFFCTIMLCRTSSLFSILAVGVIVAITMLYVKNSKAEIFFNIKSKNLIILLIAVIFGTLSMSIGIMRIATYSSPNYDFGIWCNMFHHMKEGFLPITSCERDRLMSHFCVHFSPIYYVLLPIYCIFPSPYTLNISQTLILYSGIIPMVMLMQRKRIDKLTIVLFSAIYATYPVISASSFYDIHENCFLLPLLLWVFYCYEQCKAVPFFVFSAITLLVKEDAFIYLVIFAVYILFDRKDFKKAPILIVAACIYFGVTAALMKKYGLGIMSDRFSNLTLDDEGLFGVVKTAFTNPAYFFSQIFLTRDENSDKIKYVAELFFPLCFMPFMTKKTSRFLLISPVLINLITTYVYQYEIAKQYTFGISAFLIYASILSVEEKDKLSRRYICTTATVMSVILCLSLCIPKLRGYTDTYKAEKEDYRKIEQILDKIPEDASVSISTFLLQKISDRDLVYELEYHEKPDTDYMIVDERYLTKELEDKYISKYIEAGYKVVDGYEGLISVYQK